MVTPFWSQTPFDNWVTLLSAVITVLAFLAIFFQISQMNKTIKLNLDSIKLDEDLKKITKEDINSRLRPWISFSDVKFKMLSKEYLESIGLSGEVPYADAIELDFDNNNFLVNISYKNFGAYPAKNVSLYYNYFNTTNEIDIKTIANYMSMIKICNSNLIMPCEQCIDEIKIDRNFTDLLHCYSSDYLRFYLLLSAKYSNNKNDENVCYILFGCYGNYKFKIVDSYFS
jgi:hypothetical protein